MKQNQIKELPFLRIENYENMFNVYQNSNNMYFYNLLQTIAFPEGLPANLFFKYDICAGDTWPFISYKVYDTPNLWWVIMYANEIMDPTKNPVPGTTIDIPKTQVVNEILVQIGKS